MTAFLLNLTLLVLIMVWASELLIPFVIAVVVWYLIVILANAFQTLPIIGRFVPRALTNLLALALSFFFLYLIFEIITQNITNLIRLAPFYQERIIAIKDELLTLFHLQGSPSFSDALSGFNWVPLMSKLASTMASIGRNVLIILLYVIFLLLEQHSFDHKIAGLIQDPAQLQKTRLVIKKISEQIQSYVKIKTFLSILTASLSYLVLRIVGVDFAEFWALLIFLLNYIPTIGSMIATTIPCILTLLQFETLAPFIIVTTLLIAIQVVIGNMLEPRLMGRSFNLSPLVILLSLSIWGYLWGIVGMFLCVPIMVIANIILANFKKTRPFAILLSQNGEVENL